MARALETERLSGGMPRSLTGLPHRLAERAQQETPPGEASYGLRLNASINSPPGAPWMTRALRHSHLWIKGRVSEWLELYLAASGRSDTAPTPPGLGASHAFQIYPASGCSRY